MHKKGELFYIFFYFISNVYAHIRECEWNDWKQSQSKSSDTTRRPVSNHFFTEQIIWHNEDKLYYSCIYMKYSQYTISNYYNNKVLNWIWYIYKRIYLFICKNISLRIAFINRKMIMIFYVFFCFYFFFSSFSGQWLLSMLMISCFCLFLKSINRISFSL